MKIGIYSGSFNPIHIGHLALANYLCEYEGLDQVWFLVSPHNPLKEQSDLMEDSLRLRLVQLAVAGYDKFVASDFEFHLPRPSYTIHTLDALKQRYPQHIFTLIIGSDNWHHFHRWYQWERILAENPLMIYPRLSSGCLCVAVRHKACPNTPVGGQFHLYPSGFGRRTRCPIFPSSSCLSGNL